jgi:hypothetical protein
LTHRFKTTKWILEVRLARSKDDAFHPPYLGGDKHMSPLRRVAQRLGRFAALFILFVLGLVTLKYSFGIDPAVFGLELPRSLRRTSLDWKVTMHKDEMTDRVSAMATAVEDLDGGGEMELTVVCEEAEVELRFVYFSPSVRFFRRSDNGDSFAWDRVGTSPGVQLTYRMDDRDPKVAVSRSKYLNEAELIFVATDPSRHGLLDLLFPTVHELRQAETLRVELPLLDGRVPVIEIKLAAPGLQEFFTRCPVVQAARPASRSNAAAPKDVLADSAQPSTETQAPVFQRMSATAAPQIDWKAYRGQAPDNVISDAKVRALVRSKIGSGFDEFLRGL